MKSVIKLRGRDRVKFLKALFMPPRANEKLRLAFERHREPVGDGKTLTQDSAQ